MTVILYTLYSLGNVYSRQYILLTGLSSLLQHYCVRRREGEGVGMILL